METKYLYDGKSGVKISKLENLRETLLPLVNSGSCAKADMILSVCGKRREVRTCFMTPKQYKEYIKAQEE